MSGQERLLFTVEEAAEQLAISRSRLYQEIASGRLRSVRSGRSRRIPATALSEYVVRLEKESTRALRDQRQDLTQPPGG
ncbi:MAG: excisionase family DNA-binding protein [bacterium]|nr:excisionase family DNA-binding protein [bacterium]